MTAPGLYRYYSSREKLVRHVVADMFRELSNDIRRAIAAAVPSSGPASDITAGMRTRARPTRTPPSGARTAR